MCQVIEKIKTKNYVAEIINDEDCYNPRTDYSLGTLIAFHSRYDLSDKDNWDKEELISYVEQEDVLALPVYMYEHSGIALSTSAFSCKWDSGQIGYIFVSITWNILSLSPLKIALFLRLIIDLQKHI